MIKWCGYTWESAMEGGRIIHPDRPYMWYSEECVEQLRDGTVHFKIKEDPRDVKYWDGTVYHPTMAVGIIRSKEEFDYGIFKASVQCPEGYNLWPSFWLSGTHSWPPEIDIMEAWSNDNDYFKWLRPQFPYLVPGWSTTTNVHYNQIKNNEYVINNIGSKNIPIWKQWHDPINRFIEYECVWEPDRIIFKVNGHTVRRVGKRIAHLLTKNINYKMNVIFNLWHEDPEEYHVEMNTEMIIKDFSYEPYKK